MTLVGASRLCLLVIAGLWIHSAAAEEDYLVRNWQTEEGLPDNTVTAIQQTTNGYLWIGTFNGLARFDGVQFKTFDSANTPELRSSRILSLWADAPDTLWIGTEGGGLVKMSEGHFEEVPLGHYGRSESIPALFHDRNGALWALVADKGVARLQDGRVDVFDLTNGTPAESVAGLSEDEAVQSWLAARNNLLTFRAGCWFSRPSQVPLRGSEIVAVQRGRDGGAWLAYARRLVRLGEPDRGVARTTYPWSTEFSSALVTALTEDRYGELWVGTINGGLFHATPHREFLPVVSEGPLSQKVISSILEDQNGVIWVGTYRGGLFRVKRRSVTVLMPPGAGEVNVQTVCAARDGALWLGTGGAGLYRFQQQRFVHYTEADGLANQHICAVFEDSHTNLWVGTWGGLFLRQGERFRLATRPDVIPDRVLALYEDHAGDLWVGAYGGLAKKQGGQWTLFTTADGLCHPDVRAIAEDVAGNLWVGTAGGGLDCFRDGRFTHFGEEQGFPQKMVLALYAETDGTLWIGTIAGGLTRYQDGRFTDYTTQDGLADNVIGGIIDDNLGNLWFSSQNGILRVSKQALNHYERDLSPPLPCLALSVGDGLATSLCSGAGQPVASRGADGRLWVPNMKAVAIIDPRLLQPRATTPTVRIEEVSIDGKDFVAQPDGELRVPYGRSQFEFHYTALGLPVPEAARFRCRLQGYDKEWVNAGARRYAYYGQLPPGRYQFHVMAAGSDGAWHEAASPLTLDVVPHLWEVRGFQVLGGTLLVAAAVSVILLYQRRKFQRKLERIELQQALENERRRIARDLHDDLGARITEIVLLGELAKRGEQTLGALQNKVGCMTQKVRHLVASMEEIVWTVNPKNDSLPGLVSYLCDYTERFLGAAQVSCRLEVAPGLPALPLPAQMRHNVLLAVKEALSNAARHAAATKVRLRIQLEGDGLCVEVEDDGRGFDLAGPSRAGNGLQNMRSRLQAMGGVTLITGAPGQGTTVTFRLPGRSLLQRK